LLIQQNLLNINQSNIHQQHLDNTLTVFIMRVFDDHEYNCVNKIEVYLEREWCDWTCYWRIVDRG